MTGDCRPVTKEAVEWWPVTVERATRSTAGVGDGEDVAMSKDTIRKRLQASLVEQHVCCRVHHQLKMSEKWGMTRQRGENSGWRGGHVVIRLSSFHLSTGWVDQLCPWGAALKMEMKTGEEQFSNWHQYLLKNSCWTADSPCEPRVRDHLVRRPWHPSFPRSRGRHTCPPCLRTPSKSDRVRKRPWQGRRE